MTAQLAIEHGFYDLHPHGPRIAWTLRRPSSSSSGSRSAAPAGNRDTLRAAIIAHPYGRLGGSKGDHVVVACADLLAREGWHVLTYDSRGSGASGGSTSWTASPEAHDYRQMLEEVLLPAVLDGVRAGPQGPPAKLRILLAGYSHGSLAASACSPPTHLPDHPNLTISTSYLLLSYPLSVMWALCAFRTHTFTSALERRVKGEEGERVFAVFGDRDQFTGVERYRQWALRLGEGTEAFRAREVEGADHFWRDERVKEELLLEIKLWLDAER